MQTGWWGGVVYQTPFVYFEYYSVPAEYRCTWSIVLSCHAFKYILFSSSDVRHAICFGMRMGVNWVDYAQLLPCDQSLRRYSIGLLWPSQESWRIQGYLIWDFHPIILYFGSDLTAHRVGSKNGHGSTLYLAYGGKRVFLFFPSKILRVFHWLDLWSTWQGRSLCMEYSVSIPS